MFLIEKVIYVGLLIKYKVFLWFLIFCKVVVGEYVLIYFLDVYEGWENEEVNFQFDIYIIYNGNFWICSGVQLSY